MDFNSQSKRLKLSRCLIFQINVDYDDGQQAWNESNPCRISFISRDKWLYNNIVPLTMGRIPPSLHSSLFVGLVFDSPPPHPTPPIYVTMEMLTHPPHTHPPNRPNCDKLTKGWRKTENKQLDTCPHTPLTNPPTAQDNRFQMLDLYSFHRRVDRVPGFLSSRPNWLLPPLHRLASVAPPPFGSGGGGGAHSLAGEGRAEPIRTKVQTLWYSRIVTCTIRC